MNVEISRWVDQYENGRIDRRQLVAGISGLVALLATGNSRSSHSGSEISDEPTFRTTDVNHIALNVTDIARSRDFYVKHLGMKVTRESARSCFMSCADENFVALFKSDKAGMNHYCYSLAEYDVDECEAKLREQRIEPRVVRPDGRIYFDDPDGITVQLAQKSRNS